MESVIVNSSQRPLAVSPPTLANNPLRCEVLHPEGQLAVEAQLKVPHRVASDEGGRSYYQFDLEILCLLSKTISVILCTKSY